MYLTRAGVDTTLAIIVKNTTPGNAIVFDYVHQAVVEGIQKQKEISRMCGCYFMTSDRLNFGIPEGNLCASIPSGVVMQFVLLSIIVWIDIDRGINVVKAVESCAHDSLSVDYVQDR